MPSSINAALGNGVRAAGSTSATSIGGVATNFLSGAVGGIPVVGGLASSLVNVVGGLFGGDDTPEARGGGLYDGLQKPGAQPLTADDLTYNDAKIFADVARSNNIYVQDVNKLIAFDQQSSGNSWMNVVNWFRDHSDMTGRIADYNRANPNDRITLRSASPIEAMSTVQQLTGSTATQPFVQQSGSTTDTNTGDKTTTYALIGGGVVVAIILLILILKK